MSYPIIFKTIIVRLPDGRLLHLDRSGCNNDTAGRRKEEFYGKIYTQNDFVELLRKYDSMGSDEPGFDLKIGSRYCQWKDYAKHLQRAANKMLHWDDLCETHTYCYAYIYEGIDFLSSETGEMKFYSPEEWDKVWSDWMRGKLKGSPVRRLSRVDDIHDIMDALDTGKFLEFRILK